MWNFFRSRRNVKPNPPSPEVVSNTGVLPLEIPTGDEEAGPFVPGDNFHIYQGKDTANTGNVSKSFYSGVYSKSEVYYIEMNQGPLIPLALSSIYLHQIVLRFFRPKV